MQGKMKNEAHEKANRYNEEVSWRVFRIERNKYNRLIKNSKTNHYRDSLTVRPCSRHSNCELNSLEIVILDCRKVFDG